jgi:pyruvate kinase
VHEPTATAVRSRTFPLPETSRTAGLVDLTTPNPTTPNLTTPNVTRRTKIVATLGPATRDPDLLTELISTGADVLRLNLSHGTAEQHEEMVSLARAAAERAGRHVALLADLPGPKLRLGELGGDGVVELAGGRPLTLTTDGATGDANRMPVSWHGLPHAVSKGDVIYLADGRVRLRVTGVAGEEVATTVEVGGAVSSRQGVNVPSADVTLPAVSESDLAWIDFAVDHGVDLLAVSFVRRREDLESVDLRLAQRDCDTPVIAKIEKPQAAENAEEIVQAASGGIMVARGDLGIELPIETVPVVQKRLLALAGRYAKPSITATQMLASMVRSSRPTRAEASDVANAIFDGTDAVMLSEETAIGEYPVEAVRMVDVIARETEKALPYGDWLAHRTARARDVADTVAYGAVGAVYQLDLAALVVPTRSGRTARLVSAQRPRAPVVALSPRQETVNRMNLLFGVHGALNEEPETLNELLDACARRAGELGLARSGDLIGITAGLPGQGLGTNLFEVHRVP